MAMKLLQRHNNGVTYANPEDPNYQVRFKTSNGRKSLNGIQVDNFITEIIISDLNPITVGTASANDAISVRIRVSGSSHSNARLKKILTALATDLNQWKDQSVLVGFEPTSAPTTPSN